MFEFLLTEEEKALQNEVREFVKNDVPSKMVRDMDLSLIETGRPFIEMAGKKNLLGLRFPKQYGGRGMNWVADVTAIEEVGVLGNSITCAYVMPCIVGEALDIFGTRQQKERYLRPTNEGKLYSAEALTEPRGGSDFFGATTKAVEDGDSFILNGEKRFIVGAKDSDYFLVYAKSAPQTIYSLLGTRGAGTGRLVFKDVRVPKENLVGELHNAYAVFNKMMVPERLTSGAGALGLGRASLEVATRYSTRRKAFGRTIDKFQAVNFMVADSVSTLDAARALVYAAARSVDSGADSRRLVSEAKKIGTEAAWEVINNAMQIMGGIGYTSIYPIERFLRDCRLAMIWTGTNEIMNLLIQHEYYKELKKRKIEPRDVECDAITPDDEEKVYEHGNEVPQPHQGIFSHSNWHISYL
jgi:alkylation response protein AidB-like acyl-CoA dehydrogenase